MYCINCGNQIIETQNFCGSCGAKNELIKKEVLLNTKQEDEIETTKNNIESDNSRLLNDNQNSLKTNSANEIIIFFYLLLASIIITAISYPIIVDNNKDNWAGLVVGLDKDSVIEFNTKMELEENLPLVFIISLGILVALRFFFKLITWADKNSDLNKEPQAKI